MRTLIRLLVTAVLGGVAGSVIRHVIDQRDNEEAAGELVIATTTTPILAGTVAGLVAPKRWKVLVALLVSANVAANLKTEPVDAFVQQWMERQRATKSES